MKIDIITLFPKMFEGPFSESIVKRAQEKELVQINIHNLRDWTKDKHQTVDDKPFGGGSGMILMCEPIFNCIKELKGLRQRRISLRLKSSKVKTTTKNSKLSTKRRPAFVVFPSPQGKLFNQDIAKRLSKKKHLIFLCGHYEGIDQRVIDELVDEEISIGDYVLTGGELPTAVIIDSIVRLLPGAIQGENATETDSFSGKKKLLEHPQYTRPAEFRDLKVPKVLLSGNHEEIKKWKEKESLKITKRKRPELLK